MVYILLLLSILAKSHLPAKIAVVEVNKTHYGLVLPLGNQWHTLPSVLLLTVALQNSCGAQSHALPSIPHGTEGSAGREAVTPEGVQIKATSAPSPVPTAVTASPGQWWTWGCEGVWALFSAQPEWLGGEEQWRTLPKRHLRKKQLFFLMTRARDGAAFPRKSSLAMSCLSAALEKREGTVAETLGGR